LMFCGALLIVAGLVSQVVQLAVSIRDRDQNRVPAGDFWDGLSLEWSMGAPPPEYNYAVIPQVRDRDAFAWMKTHNTAYTDPETHEVAESLLFGFWVFLMSDLVLFSLLFATYSSSTSLISSSITCAASIGPVLVLARGSPRCVRVAG
ncbi:MAG: hypothetical protein L0H75_08465, partial [Nitrosospira sp.]|nr:hypothetical protein [Nitrosospira sp.]